MRGLLALLALSLTADSVSAGPLLDRLRARAEVRKVRPGIRPAVAFQPQAAVQAPRLVTGQCGAMGCR